MSDDRVACLVAWAHHTSGSSVGILAAANHAKELGAMEDYELLVAAAAQLFQEEMLLTISTGREVLNAKKRESNKLQ